MADSFSMTLLRSLTGSSYPHSKTVASFEAGLSQFPSPPHPGATGWEIGGRKTQSALNAGSPITITDRDRTRVIVMESYSSLHSALKTLGIDISYSNNNQVQDSYNYLQQLNNYNYIFTIIFTTS